MSKQNNQQPPQAERVKETSVTPTPRAAAVEARAVESTTSAAPPASIASSVAPQPSVSPTLEATERGPGAATVPPGPGFTASSGLVHSLQQATAEERAAVAALLFPSGPGRGFDEAAVARAVEEQTKPLHRLVRQMEDELADARAQNRVGASFARVQDFTQYSEDGKVALINQHPTQVSLSLPGGGALELQPGSQLVDGALWVRAKSTAQVRAMLAAGANPYAREGIREAGTGFTKDMSEMEAMFLLKHTSSLEVLERFTYGEERSVVLDAANNQKKTIRDATEAARSRG